MDIIRKEKILDNGYTVEIRELSRGFKVLVFDNFGRIEKQCHYGTEKPAKNQFYKYCSQVKKGV